MTDLQKEHIRSLRMQGYGYKRIAQILQLSVNTVKTYARKEGLGGQRAKVSREIPTDHFCKCCGMPVLQNPLRKEKLFCSTECRMKWWGEHPELIKHRTARNLECAYCHKPFTAYKSLKRKYCSHACYIADRFGEVENDG